MTHPIYTPGADFDAHQRDMAAWTGYDTVEQLNAVHDPLHYALCDWLGVPSHSMLDAHGKPFNATLSAIEEEAVLCVGRLMAHHKVGVPE